MMHFLRLMRMETLKSEFIIFVELRLAYLTIFVEKVMLTVEFGFP